MYQIEIDDYPKERSNRKKIVPKVNKFEATEKTSFSKEIAKRHRKKDSKRITQQYRQGLEDDMDDVEIYERFGKR